MFTESIVISGRRDGKEFRQTISAAVFTDMTGDPLAEEAVDTDREDINITCSRSDWAFVQKLLRGDLVERTETNGLKYRVKTVKNDSVMGWVIQARSI